jgi:hypothetical protein
MVERNYIVEVVKQLGSYSEDGYYYDRSKVQIRFMTVVM